jgi:hypothetical protein
MQINVKIPYIIINQVVARHLMCEPAYVTLKLMHTDHCRVCGWVASICIVIHFVMKKTPLD